MLSMNNEFLVDVVSTSLQAAFCLLLAMKWGIVEDLQTKGPRLISKLASCNLCLSFWMNVFISVITFAITKESSSLLIPFYATPITRILL